MARLNLLFAMAPGFIHPGEVKKCNFAFMSPDERYMQRSLDLAVKGLGRVSPNPMVGCVIVHGEEIIGEGYHHNYGGAHAEVNAISSVRDKEKLKDSTLYVNLEPCAHFGKTPPCADLIISYGIPRVIIGTSDPYPEVSGKGIERLASAGVKVSTGILEPACRWMNRRFFTYHIHQRPYVVLKWASSKDGFLAPANHGPENRERWWITGNVARILVHKWRSEEDAILVGTGTLKSDDPNLNVRYWQGKDPVRVIVDRNGKIPTSARVFSHGAKVLLLNKIRDGIEGNVHYIKIDSKCGIIPQTLSVLYNERIMSLLIEGGAEVLNQYISNGYWDEARVLKGSKIFRDGVVAPKLTLPPASESYAGDDQLFLYLNDNSSIPSI